MGQANSSPDLRSRPITRSQSLSKRRPLVPEKKPSRSPTDRNVREDSRRDAHRPLRTRRPVAHSAIAFPDGLCIRVSPSLQDGSALCGKRSDDIRVTQANTGQQSLKRIPQSTASSASNRPYYSAASYASSGVEEVAEACAPSASHWSPDSASSAQPQYGVPALRNPIIRYSVASSKRLSRQSGSMVMSPSVSSIRSGPQGKTNLLSLSKSVQKKYRVPVRKRAITIVSAQRVAGDRYAALKESAVRAAQAANPSRRGSAASLRRRGSADNKDKVTVNRRGNLLHSTSTQLKVVARETRPNNMRYRSESSTAPSQGFQTVSKSSRSSLPAGANASAETAVTEEEPISPSTKILLGYAATNQDVADSLGSQSSLQGRRRSSTPSIARAPAGHPAHHYNRFKLDKASLPPLPPVPSTPPRLPSLFGRRSLDSSAASSRRPSVQPSVLSDDFLAAYLALDGDADNSPESRRGSSSSRRTPRKLSGLLLTMESTDTSFGEDANPEKPRARSQTSQRVASEPVSRLTVAGKGPVTSKVLPSIHEKRVEPPPRAYPNSLKTPRPSFPCSVSIAASTEDDDHSAIAQPLSLLQRRKGSIVDSISVNVAARPARSPAYSHGSSPTSIPPSHASTPTTATSLSISEAAYQVPLPHSVFAKKMVSSLKMPMPDIVRIELGDESTYVPFGKRSPGLSQGCTTPRAFTLDDLDALLDPKTWLLNSTPTPKLEGPNKYEMKKPAKILPSVQSAAESLAQAKVDVSTTSSTAISARPYPPCKPDFSGFSLRSLSPVEAQGPGRLSPPSEVSPMSQPLMNGYFPDLDSYNPVPETPVPVVYTPGREDRFSKLQAPLVTPNSVNLAIRNFDFSLPDSPLPAFNAPTPMQSVYSPLSASHSTPTIPRQQKLSTRSPSTRRETCSSTQPLRNARASSSPPSRAQRAQTLDPAISGLVVNRKPYRSRKLNAAGAEATRDERRPSIGPDAFSVRLGPPNKRGFDKTDIRDWLLAARRESVAGLSGELVEAA